MKLMVLVLATAFSVGCATAPSPEVVAVHRYAAENKPKIDRGELKRSIYYLGLYDLQVKAGAPGWALRASNQFIDNSRALEDGTIAQDEFDSRRRDLLASVKTAEDGDAANYQLEQSRRQQLAAQQMAVAAQLMQTGQSQPYRAPANDYDWDWDAFYSNGALVWACRGVQSGQFAPDNSCAYKARTDYRWPGN